jgi:hypothetical protein
MAFVTRLALALADGLMRQLRVGVEIFAGVALGAGFLRCCRKEVLPTGDVGVVTSGAFARLEGRMQGPLELPRGPREIVTIHAHLIRWGSCIDGVVAHAAVPVLEGGMGSSEQEGRLLGVMRLMARRAIDSGAVPTKVGGLEVRALFVVAIEAHPGDRLGQKPGLVASVGDVTLQTITLGRSVNRLCALGVHDIRVATGADQRRWSRQERRRIGPVSVVALGAPAFDDG